MLDGFCEGAGGGRAGGLGFAGGEDVGGQEGEAEAEVWTGEDGEGFDEDVGCAIVAREVGVELVSVIITRVCQFILTEELGLYTRGGRRGKGAFFQIELITFFASQKALR